MREQTNDTLSALRLSVSDPFAIFLAKLAANTLFSADHRAAAAAGFCRDVQRAGAAACCIGWCWCFFWGAWEFRLRARRCRQFPRRRACASCFCRLLLLPLLTPILIASTEVTAALLDRSPFVQWKGVGFLVAFDIVFLTALWLFGEYLLEE